MDIYVGNLPFDASDSDLTQLFEAYGTVSSARVIIDKATGQSKGFGFVEMQDRDEAMNAIRSLNNQEFKGRPLRVNESQPKPKTGGGGRPGGGGGGRQKRW